MLIDLPVGYPIPLIRLEIHHVYPAGWLGLNETPEASVDPASNRGQQQK
jgi:hypothetical protein